MVAERKERMATMPELKLLQGSVAYQLSPHFMAKAIPVVMPEFDSMTMWKRDFEYG